MADADLLIVGGGPAGMMAGLLFARAGVRTLVIEKHADFLRDFRGDTVHPSTLDLFAELGLLEELLARPHDKVAHLTATVGKRAWRVADFSHLDAACPFIAMMPQWEFLDVVAGAAQRYRGFALRMSCEAVGVTSAAGRVTGVTLADGEVIAAQLVIAADGRRSILREAGELPLETLGAPIDVFWFRVPKTRTADNATTGTIAPGRLIVLIDRGEYWQCAFVLAKGSAEAIRARGIAAFRDDIVAAAPVLAGAVAALGDWDDVNLLSVALDRLTRWHRPGLLAIGDAAHAMSPVGGVGINLAVQDAVAAANLLAAGMARGEAVDDLLGRVAARRMLPTRIVQTIQRVVQTQVLAPVLASRGRTVSAPLLLRLIDAVPLLQRIPAWLIGMGIRREHIHSPNAGII